MGLGSNHARGLRLRGGESGFTLVELLIVILLLAVVLSATLALLDRTNSQAAKDQERTAAANEVRAGVARMVTDVRQAGVINAGNAWQIELLVRCRSGETANCATTTVAGENDSTWTARAKKVVWRCDARNSSPSTVTNANAIYRECVRTVMLPSATANPGVVAGSGGLPNSGTAGTNPGGLTCNDLGPTGCQVAIPRVKNWDNRGPATSSVCPAGARCYDNEPIFTYRLSDSTAAPTAVDAEEIDITIRVPRGGERRNAIAGDLLIKDAVYLRNVDLF